jgi:hypothetical protein
MLDRSHPSHLNPPFILNVHKPTAILLSGGKNLALNLETSEKASAGWHPKPGK